MMKDKNYIFWLIATALYFLTRLYNLKILPIFTDEAIYTYWAQIALNDPVHRYISLEDGKQPLFIWIAAVLQNFINDPLVATRLVSVMSGFCLLVGLYFLSKELFEKKTAYFACILYIILPFTLLYDRMALFDSLLTAMGIWAIYFSVKLAKNLQLDSALLAGGAIGLALITKSSGNFFLYFLPFALMVADFRNFKKVANVAKFAFLTLIVFVLSQVIYNSLRLSPLFYLIARKNMEFIRSSDEVIRDPFLYFFSNISAMVEWTITYIGLVIFIFFILGLILGYVKREKSVIYLSILILTPFMAVALFNKVLYARFMLFYFPYVIIIISYFVIFLLKKYKKFQKAIFVIILVSILSPLITSFWLLANPPKAKISKGDYWQYVEGWPAGYGVSEIVEFLKKESESQKVLVGTEGTFGLYPFSLLIYFFGNQNVQVVGYWPVDPNNLPMQIVEMAKSDKTYFIFNENQKEINNPVLKLVSKYQKGRGDSFMRLYELNPKP